MTKVSPPPIDIGWTYKKFFEWLYQSLIAWVLFISGMILIVYSSKRLEGATYLFSFLLGMIISLIGIIWIIKVTVREMKETFVKDKIHERTKEYMKIKSTSMFYWAYAVASVLGLILAIITGNDKHLNTFVIIVVIVGLLLYYGKKKIKK